MALPKYLERALQGPALKGKKNYARFLYKHFGSQPKGDTRDQWYNLFDKVNNPRKPDTFEHDTIVLALNGQKTDAQKKTVATKILLAMTQDLQVQAGAANRTFEDALAAARLALQSIIDLRGVQLQDGQPFRVADLQVEEPRVPAEMAARVPATPPRLRLPATLQRHTTSAQTPTSHQSLCPQSAQSAMQLRPYSGNAQAVCTQRVVRRKALEEASRAGGVAGGDAGGVGGGGGGKDRRAGAMLKHLAVPESAMSRGRDGSDDEKGGGDDDGGGNESSSIVPDTFESDSPEQSPRTQQMAIMQEQLVAAQKANQQLREQLRRQELLQERQRLEDLLSAQTPKKGPKKSPKKSEGDKKSPDEAAGQADVRTTEHMLRLYVQAHLERLDNDALEVLDPDKQTLHLPPDDEVNWPLWLAQNPETANEVFTELLIEEIEFRNTVIIDSSEDEPEADEHAREWVCEGPDGTGCPAFLEQMLAAADVDLEAEQAEDKATKFPTKRNEEAAKEARDVANSLSFPMPPAATTNAECGLCGKPRVRRGPERCTRDGRSLRPQRGEMRELRFGELVGGCRRVNAAGQPIPCRGNDCPHCMPIRASNDEDEEAADEQAGSSTQSEPNEQEGGGEDEEEEADKKQGGAYGKREASPSPPVSVRRPLRRKTKPTPLSAFGSPAQRQASPLALGAGSAFVSTLRQESPVASGGASAKRPAAASVALAQKRQATEATPEPAQPVQWPGNMSFQDLPNFIKVSGVTGDHQTANGTYQLTNDRRGDMPVWQIIGGQDWCIAATPPSPSSRSRIKRWMVQSEEALSSSEGVLKWLEDASSKWPWQEGVNWMRRSSEEWEIDSAIKVEQISLGGSAH